MQKHILCQFFRYTHLEHQSKRILYPLKSRKLLNVKGSDASLFLQGLITNDMRHFDEGAKSMYAMFLNNKGRVMYDTLVHKWKHDDSYLIECDSSVINSMQKHLIMYKLRRQLEIKDVNQDIKLWALISPTVPDTTENNIHIYKDPRLVELGFRIISPVSINESQLLDILGSDIIKENSEDGYKYLRYQLGVSEGAEDLPPATSFPLEANCDYLHGVSFHKGCYIGQELTARVHHTGVVRKRFMPLKFTEDISDFIQRDTVITAKDNPKSNIGKFKSLMKDYGLGLLRIKEATDAKSLKVGDYEAEVVKPSWWPIEAPREVASKKNKTKNLENWRDMDNPKTNVEKTEVGYDFNCVSCNLSEKVHYKGTKPPFSRNIILKYPSYIMKDPFSPPGKGEILMLGADCALCDQPVCIGKECSIFYTKLFCLNCAKKTAEKFPVEIQSKLKQYKK